MKTINLPKDISYFQISEIELNKINLRVNICLINPINQEIHKLKFINVVNINISKSPDDEDGLFQIGMIKLIEIESNKDLPNNFSFEEISKGYYLRIEGDICIDIVSGKYEYDLLARTTGT